MREEASAEQHRPRGRPRDLETERRILEVALQLLREEGYNRMSVDSVALEAGVSKPTIYRRWASKADLATAAVRTLQLAEPGVNTGKSKWDLIHTLENFSRSLLRPNGMSLIGTVIAEEAHTPDLIRLFRERIVAPRRQMLRVILERAKERGELRQDAVLDCAVNMLVGAFYARYLVDSKVPSSFPRDLVETIWSGIERRKSRQTAARRGMQN
jgi:AcrR family transcriptional regulator